MNDKIRELAPIRDIPLAFAYSTIWFILLWAAEYPADERVGVVVIAYIALWVSRAVLGNLTVALLRVLRGYGMRAAERAGIEISDAVQDKGSQGANALVLLVLLSLIVAILGSSFLSATYIAPSIGLPQLGAYFAIAGLAMLAVGMLTLTLFFTLSFALFAMTESLHRRENFSARINHIEASESLVQRRLGTAPASS